MPPKKPRRSKALCPAPPPPRLPVVEEKEQPGDPLRSPPPNEMEHAAAADPVPELEHEPEAEEAGRLRKTHQLAGGQPPGSSPPLRRMHEKELIIDFLQQHPTLYFIAWEAFFL